MPYSKELQSPIHNYNIVVYSSPRSRKSRRSRSNLREFDQRIQLALELGQISGIGIGTVNCRRALVNGSISSCADLERCEFVVVNVDCIARVAVSSGDTLFGLKTSMSVT
jgi:hypothetical protein